MSSSYSPREEDVFERPVAELIQSAWSNVLGDPLLSLARLRAAALSKDGLGEADHDGGVVLRSVYWRFYLGLLPPPTSLNLFASAISLQRENYNTLRESFLVAPDGRWADDCSRSYHNDESSTGRNTSTRPAQTTFDPLSLDEQSPWKTWYAHLELRKVIMQDVDRTFPDIPYFTLERVRRSMVTMLFLFSVLNPDVGYRQGMHELLAVCLLVVDRDSLSLPTSNGSAQMVQAMYTTLNRRFVEHDAFELFMAIMKPAKAFYEWRQEEGPRTKGAAQTQAPIIIRCSNLHSSLIRRIDPQLWEKLENEGVEAQIWAMRWYKLIFTRELPFPLALKLWDGIFAEDPGLGILDFVCAAMVLLIRNELLDSDHAGLLTNLLRYPSPSPLYPFSPFLVMSQALLLRNSINPTTGVEVVIQNNEVLGVRAQPLAREPEQVKRLPRQPPPRSVQGLAAGLFERAQAAGLDKAFMSTVADLRVNPDVASDPIVRADEQKNIPDSAYSYLPNLPFSPSQTPAARDSSGSFTSFPPLSAVPRHHPPPPPLQISQSSDSLGSSKSLRDAERELAELRLAMVGMGKAMGEWLTTLPGNTGPVERQGLERVKETLLDAAGKDIDDIVKEWGWHEGLTAPSSRATTPSPSEPDTTGLMSKDDIPLAKEEITPTPQSVPSFQSVAMPSPAVRSAPIAPASKPTTYPSVPTANGQPSPTLPRTPLTAPPSRKETPHSFDQPRNASNPILTLRSPSISSPLPPTRSHPTSPASGQGPLTSTGQGGAVGDPLAGLGVSSAGIAFKSQAKEVDPLLGIGIRR